MNEYLKNPLKVEGIYNSCEEFSRIERNNL